MNRRLARRATLAVTLPLVAGLTAGLTAGSANAAESVTVPGCFGAGSTVYCDLTVRIGSPVGVRTYQTDYPVCVATCVYVPLILADTAPGEPASVCYSYRRLDNTTYSDCAGLGSVDDTVEYATGLVGESGIVEYVLAQLDGLPETVLQYVRDVLTWDECDVLAAAVAPLGGEVQCYN